VIHRIEMYFVCFESRGKGATIPRPLSRRPLQVREQVQAPRDPDGTTRNARDCKRGTSRATRRRDVEYAGDDAIQRGCRDGLTPRSSPLVLGISQGRRAPRRMLVLLALASSTWRHPGRPATS